MKILVYGINYYPELTGIGKYTGEMCEWLAARGHDVEVITGKPYYPEWKIKDNYKNTGWQTEFIHGVKVVRSPLYVPEKVTGSSRILHELSFVLSSFLFWFPRFFKQYDIVIGICPPLQAGIYPWLYKLFRNKPFLFHIQDLQVDAAKELGILKNKLLLRFLEWTEKFLLKKATAVSIISEGMKRNILKKGLGEKKIFSFPNWVDTDFIRPLDICPLKAELGFQENDKIVLYSGSMGEKQGLEIVIGAAEILKENSSLNFVFSGDGPAKNKLVQLAKKKNLRNIIFINAQPYEKLDQLLALADIHLVVQRKAASDLVFPSKLSTILAAGGVTIVTTAEKTDLYDFITQNNLGIAIQPENEEALAKAVDEILKSDHEKIKSNARIYAQEKLSKRKIMEDFEKNLFRLIA